MKKWMKIGLFTSPVLVFAAGILVLQVFFGKASKFYFSMGWLVATLNFAAAVFLFLKARKEEFKKSMVLVFGGSGCRMLIMVLIIGLIMKIVPGMVVPFAVSLLGCFVVYLVLEVALVYLLGIVNTPEPVS
jgi:hypothetical protein